MLYTAVWSPLGTPWTHHTLSEKQSKFPRYNMKCSGKHYTIREIFRVVSRFLRYISCYIAENRFSLAQWTIKPHKGRWMHILVISICLFFQNACWILQNPTAGNWCGKRGRNSSRNGCQFSTGCPNIREVAIIIFAFHWPLLCARQSVFHFLSTVLLFTLISQSRTDRN